MEVPGLVGSLPTAGTVTGVLDRTDIPMALMASPENPDSPPYRATRWLAGCLSLELREVPGGHMPYAVDPAAMAAAVRDLLTN